MPNELSAFEHIFKFVRDSKHCKGKKEHVFSYDCTGYWRFRCDCGYITGWEKIIYG